MKRSRFIETKALLLQEHEDVASLGDDCFDFAIPDANDNWHAKNSRLSPSKVLMQQLEVENSQLRRIATDLSLNNERLRRKSAGLFNSHPCDADEL